MDKFEISDFLESYNNQNRRGTCKACRKAVQWSRVHVAQHKRATCVDASPEEKSMFAKRKFEHGSNNNSVEDLSDHNTSTNCILTSEERNDIDGKFANFFYRTGISFRVADSAAFKDLIKALNPTYAESMPSAKQLSGPLLDKEFAKSSDRVGKVLEESENLTLISDGWTNVRGDHIVNFCIKAPGKKTVFYSSIDTSGISQNAVEVANAICSVIEKLGPERFCSVITDNANVMKASWDIIETTYPHISANGCAAHAMNLLVKDSRREYPALYQVAKPTIEMVCSSAASERGWSTFRFIHSRLRNRLTNERVKKLVFVYTNCAMLDQEDKFDYIFEEGAVISGTDCEESEENSENVL